LSKSPIVQVKETRPERGRREGEQRERELVHLESSPRASEGERVEREKSERGEIDNVYLPWDASQKAKTDFIF